MKDDSYYSLLDKVQDLKEEVRFWQQTCVNANAEIERLRSRIAELIDENINLEAVAKDRYCEMQTEIERLREQDAKRTELARTMLADIEAKEARIGKLEKVLGAAKFVSVYASQQYWKKLHESIVEADNE